MIAQFRRLVAAMLIVALALPLPSHAGLVATDVALQPNARQLVSELLARTEVHAALQAYGVTPSELQARVSALTDAEVAQLAARIDELPAGGANILGVILIVFLVLLLTDILGYTKVFPFTRPMKK